jgi:phosphate transport system protein
MQSITTSRSASMTPWLDRVQLVADGVNRLTSGTGRAVVAADATIAMTLLSVDGERDRCESALSAAWSDLLAPQAWRSPDQPRAIELLVALERITGFATTICLQVIHLANEPELGELSSIRHLAAIVPEMLRDALGALKSNDRPTADRVMDRSLEVDSFFAQAHSDLLNFLGTENEDGMASVRQMHAVGRLLERIGDSASEIAESVPPPPASSRDSG